MPMGWGLVAVRRVADCARASASLGQGLPRLGAACSHPETACQQNTGKAGSRGLGRGLEPAAPRMQLLSDLRGFRDKGLHQL